MCTVSWRQQPGGYLLLCNRDEKRARQPAEAPRVWRRSGLRFLAPRDGEAGGTWIGVNEYALSLCLLNGPGGGGVRSRGWLVWDLLDARTPEDVAARMDASDLAPFVLLALAPDQKPLVIEWDGAGRRTVDATVPLVSSSVEPEAVAAARRAEFAAGADLASFHRSHAPEPGPYSVCMHRTDACTVSFSRVRVRRGVAELLYRPGALCEPAAAVTRRLRCRS